MHDLNDFYYFVKVVEFGGFAPASRALGKPKSMLSRRIALLETRLSVRLIQRSTRRFAVTDVGQTFYEHCKTMLAAAEAATQSIELSRSEPRGSLRLSCPVALLHARVGAMLAEFLAQCPNVTIHVRALNRPVDVIAEGFDFAIRVRPAPLRDSELVLKMLATRAQCLVASPALLRQHGVPSVPTELARYPSLAIGQSPEGHEWTLQGPQRARAAIRHTPRLLTDDMATVRLAALAGVGIAHLPRMLVADDLMQQTLVEILPQWAPPPELVHAVLPSRRYLLPAVRALIDFLADRFQRLDER
jgi:DNA-binding transcriptional LysR family regulator